MPGSNDPNTGVIEEFRANGGKVGGYFEGATLLILHTKGVKTGLARIKPLDYLPDGERFVVFGTKGGAPTDPYWVRNVLADREPSVELGDRVVAVRAAEITGAEADELYARQVERRPGFSEYKRKTSRWIPVIALDPVG
jgi:deazaflavin-dependent oxidoreductase (nitroreductase family)